MIGQKVFSAFLNFIFQPFFSSPRVPRVRTPSISSSVRCPPGVNPRPDFVDYLIPGQETEELSKIGSAQRRRPGESRVTLPARDPRQGLARDPRQGLARDPRRGSSQTGRVPGGTAIQVGPPAYLSIPGFEQCLEEFTPVGGSHSQHCLPQRRPYNCAEQSWEGLQNVFEGDCPVVSQAPPGFGGVGAPAYLSIPGFEQCLEEFIPVGTDHSENCLPHKKPYNCNQRAWEELQNVFEGKCPHSSPVTDLKTLFECEKDFDCPLNIPHCNRMLSPTPSGKMGYCVPSRCQDKGASF